MVPEPKLPGRKETHQRLACYLNNSEALLSSFSMQTPEKPVPFVKPTTDGCYQGDPFGAERRLVQLYGI